MGTRTTYTSTLRVPVYASWKCEQCGEVNFSSGIIACREEESTSSWRSSKHEEAKLKAQQHLQAVWADNVYRIITDPHHNATSMRRDFFLQRTNCTKCGRKPRWDKDMKYLSWTAYSLVGAVVCGVTALAMETNLIAWAVFLALLGVVIYGFVSEKQYKKTMEALPVEYTPVIGSPNEEIIEYAKEFGTYIPSPTECVELVKNYEKNMTLTNTKPTLDEGINGKNILKEDTCFCRKCGTKLKFDSEFCHKCGTAVFRE